MVLWNREATAEQRIVGYLQTWNSGDCQGGVVGGVTGWEGEAVLFGGDTEHYIEESRC